MIAAYGIVVGALVAYWLWLRAQRRALDRRGAGARRNRHAATADGAPGAPGSR